VAKLSIYKYVRTDKGWRYCKAAFHPNGKIKPNVVVVSGVEEKHTEGRYFLNFNNQWIDVGKDALEAQRRRLLRLNQIEYERLSGTSLPANPVRHPSVVWRKPRKVSQRTLGCLSLFLAARIARRVSSPGLARREREPRDGRSDNQIGDVQRRAGGTDCAESERILQSWSGFLLHAFCRNTRGSRRRVPAPVSRVQP
jgi:hypothetical protein